MLTVDINNVDSIFLPWSSLSSSLAMSPKSQAFKGRDWEKEELPTIGEDDVRDNVRNMNASKSVGSDEMNWQMKLLGHNHHI